MSLQLHVWGPAFGLPSIDPECLAAAAYLARAAPRRAWSLVATSPSAVSHALPALRDAGTGRWVASGFESVVAYVRARAAAGVADPSDPSDPSDRFVDLDAGRTPAQTADATAYAAFLRAEAAPLLALSLYVSSANWAATTRPAYSRILPFPLAWIEPPAVRAAHLAAAAHLGFSSLDTDTADEEAHPPPPSAPASFTTSVASRVSQALARTPEAHAQIRLDAAANTCLSVLAQAQAQAQKNRGGGGFLRADAPTSLDCLAFGYLALMLVPDVPRPFLRDALRRHHPALAVFVADMRRACFGAADAMPATTATAAAAAAATTAVAVGPAQRALHPLWLRTLDGLVRSVPGLGGAWLAWLWWQVRGDDADDADNGADEDDNTRTGRAASRRQRRRRQRRQRQLAAVSATAAGAALLVGLGLAYRRLPPFGAPVVVYRRPPRALGGGSGLGAAGALLGLL